MVRKRQTWYRWIQQEKNYQMSTMLEMPVWKQRSLLRCLEANSENGGGVILFLFYTLLAIIHLVFGAQNKGEGLVFNSKCTFTDKFE